MDPDRLSKIPTDDFDEPIFAMVRITANREKTIPDSFKRLIPSSDISILSLLDVPLPTISSTANVLPLAESCAVCKPPSWNNDQLMAMQVPPKDWLAALDDAIIEGWLRGVRSVEHPSDENVRFPLWVGTFWTALSEVILEQRAWRRAQEWVCALPQGHETHGLRAVLGRVPWKADIWVLPVEADRAVTKISFFAKLLSDGFLAERHIDAFITHLNIQARRTNPSAPGTLVADLSLSLALSLHHNASSDKINDCKTLLQHIAVFKSNKAYRVLLFPAHVGGVEDGHWVVFRVDFSRHEYSYGELWT
jgi:hypothetical protein